MRLRGPGFADKVVRREAFEGLESPRDIIGVDEVLQMGSQLVVALGQGPQALLMVWTPLAPILPMIEAWQVGVVEYLQRSDANGQG